MPDVSIVCRLLFISARSKYLFADFPEQLVQLRIIFNSARRSDRESITFTGEIFDGVSARACASPDFYRFARCLDSGKPVRINFDRLVCYDCFHRLRRFIESTLGWSGFIVRRAQLDNYVPAGDKLVPQRLIFLKIHSQKFSAFA